MTTENEIRQANDRFYAALNALFRGDMKPMQTIWSHSHDVTLEGPFGGILMGYEDVLEEFRREADMQLSGTVEPEDVLVWPGQDFSFVVCSEIGKSFTIQGRPVSISHRATNVFRLETEGWKMIHHHTDLAPSLQAASAEPSVASF